MTSAYFETSDGRWFRPTDFSRGPWDAEACHAGPPLGLMVRALEQLDVGQRLARITVEIGRPIPMAGFEVTAEVRRRGRSVTTTTAAIVDGDGRPIAQADALHIRLRERFELSTADIHVPQLDEAVPGPFPITETRHELTAFPASLEVRYDPGQSQGDGGPTTMWMRCLPLLADEEPSGFQRISALADSGNGISYNDYLDRVLFVNPDLTVGFHREPEGEWFCTRVRSHWQPDGVGLTTAELFDVAGHVGMAMQTLILNPI